MAAGVQGAVDSLLGRLTSVLLDEAQLLGGLRGDVEFIKDEMETMHGLLRHLTDAQHRNHLVRAWMKQVTGLARDCEGNVELYLHWVGGGADPGAAGNSNSLLRHLRRLLGLLQSVPARHRIATRIRQLKVRARDVGDRRKRYGITVPDLGVATGSGGDALSSPLAAVTCDDEEDIRRLAVLFDDHGADFPADGEVVGKCTNFLVKWLQNGEPPQPLVRIFSVVGAEWADEVTNIVYKHPCLPTLFDCKAWCFVSRSSRTDRVGKALGQILEEIAGVRPTTTAHVDEDELTEEKSVISELQGHLKGKRFFIIVTTDDRFVDEQDYYWKRIVDALLHAAEGCHPGSAIILTVGDAQMARSSSPYKTINAAPTYMHEFIAKKAKQSALIRWRDAILRLCKPNAFAMKTFLHLLYINPSRTGDQLAEYRNDISECKRLKRSISKLLLMRCYNELPSKYRSCLLYLTIFPQGHVIRTTSLARRWVAEGLITAAAATSNDDRIMQSGTDEAEHYMDALFIAGFVTPLEISAAGNIKSFTVHQQVREFSASIAGEVSFVDATRPTDFAHHLSIHSRVGSQKSESDSKGIVASLLSLAGSPQWQVLKLLELEGCKGLMKKHLKSICKIVLLRYLSLRNTDVVQLPKQIKDLHCLETLDIRQMQVRMLAKKAIVLPQLKHFLAGHSISGSIARTRIPEKSGSAVQMPLGVQKMKNMEILSHVHVSNSEIELSAIALLLKLRKLGVSLHSEKLEDLLSQIAENLSACLRSLSIRIDQPVGHENQDARITTDALHLLPNFIERLSICGIKSGLVYSIKDHHQLTKITLSESFLGEDDICILGKISKLRGLRLLHNSYTAASKLSFKAEGFQHLRSLVVDSSNITNISFDNGAAPNLEMIAWSFSTLEALSGLRNLCRLMKLELNGDCSDQQLILVKEQIIWDYPDYLNHFKIEHNNPRNQREEDGTAVLEASSLSAP